MIGADSSIKQDILQQHSCIDHFFSLVIEADFYGDAGRVIDISQR